MSIAVYDSNMQTVHIGATGKGTTADPYVLSVTGDTGGESGASLVEVEGAPAVNGALPVSLGSVEQWL